jgi:uncharacterized membrane protein YdjX (TVP38/TMEM64 family)
LAPTPAPRVPERRFLRRIAPLALLLLGGALFIALGGYRYLSLAAIAANRERLVAMVAEAGALAALAYIGLYAGLVALIFPAAELLTIAGGFLFGRWLGTLYAVVGATAGATLEFLAARAGLAGLAARAGGWAERVHEGFRRDALSYLLVLRLVPLVPFWIVNLVAAGAGLPLPVFIVGTVVGIIPGAFVYASLGTGLGELAAQGTAPGLAALLHPGIILPILGLAGLALLPVFYGRWRARRRPTP